MLLFLSLSTELFLGHREERTPADPSKRGQDALIPEASALCRDQMHKTNHEYLFRGGKGSLNCDLNLCLVSSLPSLTFLPNQKWFHQ